MFTFEWDGQVFKGFDTLCAAVYAKLGDEVKHLSTPDAAALIVTTLGYHKGMGIEALRAVDELRSAANPYHVRQNIIEVARLHQKASTAALKGDKSDYAKGFRRAETSFLRYLEELNRGRTIKEAEDAVS